MSRVGAELRGVHVVCHASSRERRLCFAHPATDGTGSTGAAGSGRGGAAAVTLPARLDLCHTENVAAPKSADHPTGFGIGPADRRDSPRRPAGSHLRHGMTGPEPQLCPDRWVGHPDNWTAMALADPSGDCVGRFAVSIMLPLTAAYTVGVEASSPASTEGCGWRVGTPQLARLSERGARSSPRRSRALSSGRASSKAASRARWAAGPPSP